MKRIPIIFIIFFFCRIFAFSDCYKSNVTASYYAEAFHGKKTSNGEIFNMYSLTCAHKMLPFNTVVKVTNLKNGKSVQVRVNDRGPFVANREMDLSKAAAVKLDMIKSGTAKVNIQIVSLGKNTKESVQTAQKACKMAGISYNPNFTNSHKTSAAKQEKKSVSAAQPSETEKNELWDIQLGAFSSKSNANSLAQKLLKAGFSDVAFQTSGDVVRVVIRKVPSEELPKIEKKLKQGGWGEYTVKKRTAK